MIGWITAFIACASLHGSSVEQSTSVVPEREIVNTVSETKGVTAKTLGTIDLRSEFSGINEQLVLRARQITIQPDGTVHGGTGWSVELAKRWYKPIWVFDPRLVSIVHALVF